MIYSEVNARNQVEFITGGYRDFAHPEPGEIHFELVAVSYDMLVALSRAFDTQVINIEALAEHRLVVTILFTETGEAGASR